VRSDPEPDEIVSVHPRESAVSETYSNGIDVVLIVDLLEIESGMSWIATK
jgi:hypothetical protein